MHRCVVKPFLSGANEALKPNTNLAVTSEAEQLGEALQEVTLAVVYFLILCFRSPFVRSATRHESIVKKLRS